MAPRQSVEGYSMNIAGYGHFATSVSAVSPARDSLRSVSAESQLATESPVVPVTKLPSASAGEAKFVRTQGAASGVANQSTPTAAQERLVLLQVAELSSRDREVRAHELAHAAVGGSHAGAPSYTFKRGPDGRSYAVGGEVAIDVGAIANDPAATVRKMQQVKRAALAPADPSGQDISIAARAQVLAAQQRDAVASAIAEGKTEAAERYQTEQDKLADKDPQSTNASDSTSLSKTTQQDFQLAPNLQVYRRVGALHEASNLLNVVTKFACARCLTRHRRKRMFQTPV
jgi:hypothetical protein